MINEKIQQHLIDFYLQFKDEKHFFESKNIISFSGKWPNINLLKTDVYNFDDLLLSKNWILPNKFVHKNLTTIKKERLIPVANWTNMHLNKTELYSVKKLPDFKVEILTEKDVPEFVNIINKSIFKKETLLNEQILKHLNNPDFYFYIGKYKNKPVTTCMLMDNKKNIGLYFIATDKDFRKKGYSANTIKTALNQLINKQKSNFVLHATEMGKKVYSKLGFKSYDKLLIFVKI